MKKLKQSKFSRDHKRTDNVDAVFFFDPEKKYQRGDSFIIPNMASFIHDVSEYGNVGALKKRVLKLNPLQLLRLFWWNKFQLGSIAKKEFHAGVLLLVQIELLQLLKYRPATVIVSDQINDLSFSLNNRKILLGAKKLITQKLKIKMGIMTNNLVVAAKKMIEWKVVPAFIFTPFNRFGYEMNPDKESVERIVEFIEPSRIVAISPELKQEDKAYLEEHGITNVFVNWF